ncbi:MAG TPA: alpha-ketoglutarate-dependent dioxygenase AlkB [Acidimicrobiales bacterium]|nr:alpha-ketoglutarate-dependent dioxygenase AlkB [Acidimicrobiales bacterium]
MGTLADAAIRDDVDVERVWLDDTSWVDVARGWLAGADAVHAAVLDRAAWRQSKLWRYDHWVEEPRLGASARIGAEPLHPALADLQRALQRRYGVTFGAPAVALYRDGNDSVAFHRDRDLRWLDDTLIAIVSLGQRRPWHLRPRANRFAHDLPNQGATVDISPAAGDLLVMGGRSQADWEHSVPKVRHPLGPRISLQWRWTSRQGRPVQGPSYRAPRTFRR